MAYVPDWERLCGALKRVLATGISEEEAKSDICSAVADRKISVRLILDTEPDALMLWPEMMLRAQGLGAVPTRSPPLKSFEGAKVKAPINLAPDELDWENSRPLTPWEILARVATSDWRPSPECVIELRTVDVSNVLCSSKEVSKPQLEMAKRGRPATYNWHGVQLKLADYSRQNGPVKTLTELLTKCSEFAEELHPKSKTPDDNTIRAAIRTHKLDIAARFDPGNAPEK